MYRRSRSCHTLSSRPWAERQNLVYGFSVVLAIRQVGTYIPLSPSLGLSQRAETTLLNKLVEISTTTRRFCSWCQKPLRRGMIPQPPDRQSGALPKLCYGAILIAGTGFEPVFAAYEAAVVPLQLNPQSRRPDSNRQPADYKSAALPLRHDGIDRFPFGRLVNGGDSPSLMGNEVQYSFHITPTDVKQLEDE